MCVFSYSIWIILWLKRNKRVPRFPFPQFGSNLEWRVGISEQHEIFYERNGDADQLMIMGGIHIWENFQQNGNDLGT